MSLPLATLTRNATTVLLDEPFARSREAMGGSGIPDPIVEFRTPQDAVMYLRFWKGDAGAMTQLRNALLRYRRIPVSHMTVDGVIGALAAYLASGQLVMRAAPPSRPRRGKPIPRPPAAAPPAPPPAPIPAALRMPPVPVLPKLVQVQIEGARVLPEVMQTLEQLDVTMAEIGLASVSLEPAPAGIPPIGSALNQASGSITSTLGEI